MNLYWTGANFSAMLAATVRAKVPVQRTQKVGRWLTLYGKACPMDCQMLVGDTYARKNERACFLFTYRYRV